MKVLFLMQLIEMKIFMAKRASKLQMKIFYMVYFFLNLKKFGCCLFTLLSKEKSLSLSLKRSAKLMKLRTIKSSVID